MTLIRYFVNGFTIGLRNKPFSFLLLSRSYSSDNIAHTLDVKQKVDQKRKHALLGGGIKRIENQHKKAIQNANQFSIFN